MQPGSSWTTSELNSADETPGDEHSFSRILGLPQPIAENFSGKAPVHNAVVVSLSYQFVSSMTRSHVLRGAEGSL